jgi:putative oxidoreductase
MTYVSEPVRAAPRGGDIAVTGKPAVTMTDVGLLVLRIVVGVVFAAHGAQKVFGMGFDGVTNGFAQMGIPLPHVTGPLVAVLELTGGVALILGALTRLFALGLAINMLGAIYFVHLPNGFFLPNGIEFAFTLCGACLAIMLIGAGFLSVDGAIGRRKYRVAVYPREQLQTVTAA